MGYGNFGIICRRVLDLFIYFWIVAISVDYFQVDLFIRAFTVHLISKTNKLSSYIMLFPIINAKKVSREHVTKTFFFFKSKKKRF